MRESQRPSAEQEAISRALTVLAIATRDTTIDAGVKKVYMPHLDGYSVPEIERACELLHTALWFPKLGELLAACSKARRKFQDEAIAHREATAPRYLNAPPNPERHAELMAKIRETCRIKRMPHAEADDEQA